VRTQLSTKAAATIWGRVVAALGGDACVTPTHVLAAPVTTLRAAGLSGRKAEYLQSLAAAFAEQRLSSEALAALSDDAAVAALTQVRGLGVWSAHMFLIFGLNRADVLPWGDYGIRKAYRKLYGGGAALPARAELEAAAADWAPHRSLAAWYLWRALDATPAP
jgi:DNA-3-methyladenine glycosylase II